MFSHEILHANSAKTQRENWTQETKRQFSGHHWEQEDKGKKLKTQRGEIEDFYTQPNY